MFRNRGVIVVLGLLLIGPGCGSDTTGKNDVATDSSDLSSAEISADSTAAREVGPEDLSNDVPATQDVLDTVELDAGDLHADAVGEASQPDLLADNGGSELTDLTEDGAADLQPDLPAEVANDTSPDVPPEVVAPPQAGLECVGKIVWPQPPTETYSYTYHIMEFPSQNLAAGVTLKICNKDDLTCQNPVDQGITNAQGEVTLTIPAGPQGLDGYVQFEKMGIVPQVGFYSYVDNIEVYGENQGYYYYVVTDAVYQAFLANSGLELLPGRGFINASFMDCNQKPTPGVQISCPAADDKSSITYTVNGVPTPGTTQTSAEGHANLFNVPAGWTKLQAVHAATGILMGEIDILVQEGMVTGVVMGPTPL